MAWTSAALSADELANFAADKPLLASCERRDNAKWTLTGIATDTDLSATGYPALRVDDGKAHLKTKPNAAATTWYLHSYLLSGFNFDSVFVVNHNFGTIGCTCTFQIADDSAFTTNLQDIATGAPSNDGRISRLSLYHTGSVARRYSGVQFVRIKMVFGSAQTPEVGEIILGNRSQLAYAPERPFDPEQYGARADSFVSLGGVRQTITRHKGQKLLNAQFVDDDETRIAEIQAFYERSDYGAEPFIWLPNPTTAPGAFYLMQMPDYGVNLQRTSGLLRRWSLVAEEQGPESCFMSAQ